jgi:hypothetical protein
MAPYGEPPTRERVLIEAQRYNGDEAIFADLFRGLLNGAGLSYPTNHKVRLHLPGGHWVPIDFTHQVEAIERQLDAVNTDRKAKHG